MQLTNLIHTLNKKIKIHPSDGALYQLDYKAETLIERVRVNIF